MAVTEKEQSIERVIDDAFRASPFTNEVLRCKAVPADSEARWRLNAGDTQEGVELHGVVVRLASTIPVGTNWSVACGLLNVQERRAAEDFLTRQSKVRGYFDTRMCDLLVTVRSGWLAEYDQAEQAWRCHRLVSFAVLA